MYSVRLRASRDDRHISGAEGLVSEQVIPASMIALLERAMSHQRGRPDSINITIEKIDREVQHVPSLPVKLLNTENIEEGRNAAKEILCFVGVPRSCVDSAFSLLEKGPVDGKSMRGAIIMDREGNRLEPDKHRGIRATRMDISRDASVQLEAALSEKGLSEYYIHIQEALVLATKVALVRGTIAELCRSDDPDYTTGYVASKYLGYVRIPHLKQKGDDRGGRIFFVDTIDQEDYIRQMQQSPLLVTQFAGLQEYSDHSTLIQEECA